MGGQQVKFMQRQIIRGRQSLLLKQIRIRFLGASLPPPGIHLALTNQILIPSPSQLTSALSTQSTQPRQLMLSLVTHHMVQHLAIPTSSTSPTTQTPLIQAMLMLAVLYTLTLLRQLMAIVRCLMVITTFQQLTWKSTRLVLSHEYTY